jgi:hypothetical protein
MTDHGKYQFDNYAFPPDFRPLFTNTHVMSSNEREFFITFGCIHPPNKDVKSVAQLVLSRDHVMELIFNLQNQLRKFDEQKVK